MFATVAMLATLATAKPTLNEFIGLNVHTVQFRPDLYRPIARHLRNYHPVEWDLGNDSGYWPQFPFARNRVNWDDLYGAWRKAGYVTIASLMFETLPKGAWSRDEDAEAYGFAVGRFFGGSGALDAVEIGNEPEISDTDYTRIFGAMARGVRRGNAKLKVATCAMRNAPSERYFKSLETVRPHLDLVDVITVHTYSELEPWPTFKRAHPEDPVAKFLQPVQEAIAWRDRHAPGKPVWVTEFGWDSSTQKPDPNGEWAKWVGNADAEQAAWTVRAFLEFSRLDVARAYLYWFNDEDVPHMHASSGLTRKYSPKPSYHAVAQLQRELGAFRFRRSIVREAGKRYVLEFVRGDDEAERCWVAWVPTREGNALKTILPKPDGDFTRAVGPMRTATPPTDGLLPNSARPEVLITGDPIYLFWRARA